MTFASRHFDHEEVRRILLVIDDFNELVGLETLFRRLGFDVLSLGRESLVTEAILGFPPDLVVATGRGRHVDGLNLAPKLRYGGSQPKLVVLLRNQGADSLASDPRLLYADVDAVIETPFEPRDAMRVVARLLGLPPEPLLEKYGKIVSARLFEPEELKILKHHEPALPIVHVTGSNPTLRPPPARIISEPEAVYERPLSAREKKYQKFLDEKMGEALPPMADIGRMREARQKLEADENSASIEESQKLAKLNREKREFVRAMIETARGMVPQVWATDLTDKKKEEE